LEALELSLANLIFSVAVVVVVGIASLAKAESHVRPFGRSARFAAVELS
jgi:hypothetical protein